MYNTQGAFTAKDGNLHTQVSSDDVGLVSMKGRAEREVTKASSGRGSLGSCERCTSTGDGEEAEVCSISGRHWADRSTAGTKGFSSQRSHRRLVDESRS